MEKFIKSQTEIFELLSKTISEGVIIVDEAQKIVAANRQLHHMFAYDEDELIGKNLETLIPSNFRSQHEGYSHQFILSGDQRKMGTGRDLSGITKSGTTFPVEVSLNPLQLGDQRFVMAIVSDITYQKEQELKILHLNSHLESLVNERTQKLKLNVKALKKEVAKRKKAESKIKEALGKEKELNELKTKFLSLVSHEFKTPLNVILSSATLTEKYTRTADQSKREKHLNTIKKKIKTLNTILDDFLSIERIAGGVDSYKKEKFPLSRVINNVVYDANMNSKEGQIINYPDNIHNLEVFYDENILRLSLNNIINNAIKYSPKNSTIDIRIKKDDDFLYISISDEGIGIPEKEQKFIFNPYFRAENALLKKGTGIGLNIVKDHLENLNSSIHFKSVENEGSTFTIKIPYKE